MNLELFTVISIFYLNQLVTCSEFGGKLFLHFIPDQHVYKLNTSPSKVKDWLQVVVFLCLNLFIIYCTYHF